MMNRRSFVIATATMTCCATIITTKPIIATAAIVTNGLQIDNTVTTTTTSITDIANTAGIIKIITIPITLTDPTMKLGVQLANQMDSLSNKAVVVVQRIVTTSPPLPPPPLPPTPRIISHTNVIRSNNSTSYHEYTVHDLQVGMILLNYTNAKELQDILQRKESYPITLLFQPPPSLLSSSSSSSLSNNFDDNTYQIVKLSSTCSSSSNTYENGNDFVQPQPQPQQLSSQRGDVLEIIYTARIGSETGRIYDSSDQRGTGQPYQMVLGSGDMMTGVDQGLYDMCLNEVRGIYIPSRLAYSTRGNRIYQIPPNTNLYWQVRLVRIS